MPEMISALASDFGESASGGGIMPASPQTSALDEGSHVRDLGAHNIWIPFNKDVIDQVLNAALAKMTTASDDQVSIEEPRECSKENISNNIDVHDAQKNDLKCGNQETASCIPMDENKNKKLEMIEKSNALNNYGTIKHEAPSLMESDICGFTRQKVMRSPESCMSDSRSSGSPLLNDGWVPVPRSALDSLIASEFNKFEEQESQSKKQKSPRTGVQTAAESSVSESGGSKRDQSSSTNSSHHSSPLPVKSRTPSVIVSKKPESEMAPASPKDTPTPSQKNDQIARPHIKDTTAKDDKDSEHETRSWVMLERVTLENLVEEAMTGEVKETRNVQHSKVESAAVSLDNIAKVNCNSKKKCDNVNTAKKRTIGKQKRSAGTSPVQGPDNSKKVRVLEPPAAPPKHSYFGNSLQELLQPGAELSVPGRPPIVVPSYPHFVPHPSMQSLPLPARSPLSVPTFLPLHENTEARSAFHAPGTALRRSSTETPVVAIRSTPVTFTDPCITPLDLSQKESTPNNKTPVATRPDNNNHSNAIPAVHHTNSPLSSNNVNGMPVNNQCVPSELAASGGVSAAHNTQAKANRLSAEPPLKSKEARKSSPRSEDMGTPSPRGSPWVVLDINQVDNIIDRVLQEDRKTDQNNGAAPVQEPPSSIITDQGNSPESLIAEPKEKSPNTPRNKEHFNFTLEDTVSRSPQTDEMSEDKGSPMGSPRQCSPGGAGFKWKSDLLRKFTGGTDESDCSSGSDQSPSPTQLPHHDEELDPQIDNQNNNMTSAPVVIPKQSGSKKLHRRKPKRASKRSSNNR